MTEKTPLKDMDPVELLQGLHHLLAAAWSPRGHKELWIIERGIQEIEDLRKRLDEHQSSRS